ncbi:MAG TPA: Stf0 family sulfotransferase [Devosia sp.]|nr:Stf0 family sulfotransferase [Devosia sp.]
MAVASYIICATPRSGSTLLCDLLAQTGAAGHPDSFYRRESRDDFVREFGIACGDGVDFDRRFLDAAIRAGAGETGMFGLRLMWPSMPELQQTLGGLFPEAPTDAARLAAAFGAPLYIHLQRTDRVAQAISRSKAEQSGLWHRHADGSVREQVNSYRAPQYDRAGIDRALAEVEEHEAAWHDWFAANAIGPLELTYEELSAEPAATLARVLFTLGRDPALASDIRTKSGRLADAESRAWAERYLRETAR